MSDAECVAFLKWALPRLELRWRGFRRMHGQVCKRIARRLRELELADLAAYRSYLHEHPDEWTQLDALCRVTVSRFARDRHVWSALVADVLPRIARAASERPTRAAAAWSAGCGAGEEPYTLAVAWRLEIEPRFGVALDISATDRDARQLERARAASYPTGALRELPEAWREAAFELAGSEARLGPEPPTNVRFMRHDLRSPPLPGPFDLILCRNLAFSYFDEALQRKVATALHAVLRPAGVLVVGLDEALPQDLSGWKLTGPCLYEAITL